LQRSVVPAKIAVLSTSETIPSAERPRFQSLTGLLTSRPLRLERTLIAVLQSALEELGGERAGIMLFEQDAVQLAIDRSGERVDLGPDVLAWAESRRTDPTAAYLHGPDAPGDSAWCALEPLAITVREQAQTSHEMRRIPGDDVALILGNLYLDGSDERRPFSSEESGILRSLAQHAVTAVSHSQLYQQAICDELTGLVGRAELERTLTRELEVAQQRNTPLGLVYVDIDRMKQLNDRLGYAGGNQIIEQVARLLEQNTREIDTCARHGGARFALVLPETDAEGVKTLGKKLCSAVRKTFKKEPRVTFCVGGATFPDHGTQPAALKESADRALSSAKQSGPGTLRFFNQRTKSHDRFDKLAGLYTGKYAQDYRNTALVLEALSHLAQQRNPASLARYALPRLLEAARAHAGTIFLRDGEGGMDAVTAQDCRGKAIETHALDGALITQLEQRPTPVARLEDGPPRYYLAFPGSENLLGIFCCEFEADALPDAESLALATLFCELISQTLENILLLRTLEEQTQELAENSERIEKLNAQLGEKLASREHELERLRSHTTDGVSRQSLKYDYAEIIGSSKAMLNVLSMMDKVVESEVPVMIQGESGTGKELIARAIHQFGARKDKPFVTENCAALTETLLESELFGYVRGAFTGAVANKKGLFEVAHTGTLFLDEMGDMSPGLQKKLLRALQEGEIRPVGGKRLKKVDVRIISATNRNLKQMMEAGLFREDLFYRLNVVAVHLPALRERKEDIPLLLDHFFKIVSKKSGVPIKSMTPETIEYLTHYDWHGNIRDMENEVNRMPFMGDDPITPDILSDNITQ